MEVDLKFMLFLLKPNNLPSNSIVPANESLTLALLSMAILFLNACGGGGSESSTPIKIQPTNASPTISGNPSSIVNIDESYIFTPTATDVDGDSLTYSLSNAPVWIGFNSTTGALSGTPTQGDANTYSDIILTVTDNDGASASLPAFSILVNTPPVAMVNYSESISEGTENEFNASDSVDSENHTFDYLWKQEAGVAIDIGADNLPTLTFTSPLIDDEESLLFSLKLTDEYGASTKYQFSVLLQPDNSPLVTCTSDCDEALRINEAVSSNATFSDDDGDEGDWLEIFNFGNENIALEGWTITDDISDPGQWSFPDFNLSANDYIVIWASSKDRYDTNAEIFHANFKISSKGETLYLFNPAGNLISSLPVEGVAPEKSTGISVSDASIVYYDEPTPGLKNSTSEFVGFTSTDIVFSHNGGKTDRISLNLSGTLASESIRYTLDSAIPDENSIVYNEPIDIDKTTVVRARVFRSGYIPSTASNRTYIIDAIHDIPIVTLVSEPDNLFDNDTGIYVLGDNYQTARPNYGANFWEDWERDVHFSFYEENGELGTSLNAGLKIFGGWSRASAQRSFSIFARGRYGTKEIEYPLFPQLSYDEFQAVVLRNSGSDWARSMLRDISLTSLMDGSGIETQAYRSVAVYLNGGYWGLYNLREKVNEHFLASKHDVDESDVDLLSANAVVIEGSNAEYLDLIDFVANNDLSSSENFNHVEGLIDVDNFIRYYVAQIFFNNKDWPSGNIKFWKSPTTKWRWILFDTDLSTGIFISNNYADNALARALAADGPNYPNPPRSTLLFRRLIENSIFREQFINHFADELNSRFMPSNVTAHIDSIAAKMQNEIPQHFERWEIVRSWANAVGSMKDWLSNRPSFVKSHILSEFSLVNIHRLSITNIDTLQGTVTLNSLSLDQSSWAGDYFEGVPVTLTAVPTEGYVFSNWAGDSIATTATIELNLTADTVVSPVFTTSP